ncbi:hypothetical protein D3C78_973990 [compost metagenome]
MRKLHPRQPLGWLSILSRMLLRGYGAALLLSRTLLLNQTAGRRKAKQSKVCALCLYMASSLLMTILKVNSGHMLTESIVWTGA